MKGISRTSLVFALLGLLAALFVALPARRDQGFDTAAFMGLPVLEGGRIKPLDTVARNSLLVLRNQQQFRHEGRLVDSRHWLLDTLFAPERADAQPIFAINDPELLGLMKLQQGSSRYYSLDTLKPHLGEIEHQAHLAEGIPAQARSRFQAAVVNLYRGLVANHKLQHTLQAAGSPGLGWELRSESTEDREARLAALGQLATFRILLPTAGQPPEAWLTVGEALQAHHQGRTHPGLDALARAGDAWRAGDASAFNGATAQLRALAEGTRPEAMSTARHEEVFNRAQPFIMGAVLYVLAMLAAFFSWSPWRRDFFRDSAYGLLIAAVLVHTLGLASRVILQGRPPVTNLYSSAVFVGWGTTVLGLFLERMHRKGIGSAVAGAAGFASLVVAHHLGQDGDTMEMMRAVLDSNFWLATHVITITIGYSGMFLAGGLAIAYTVRKHLARNLEEATTRALLQMTYGVMAFALFFSFVGTVLGGIWADQSWGRFWGWDPKENGALLIVLWCAIMLHARWGGFVRERGFMVMAIFGNVITSLSWFGVNMLGVGLHSYGFMDSAFFSLMAFILSQLLFMGLCLLPRRFWARPEA